MTDDIKVLQPGELQNSVGVVIGTRPGFVMLAPIISELDGRGINYFVIHTGQHYSPNMDFQFFEDLKLEMPAFRLEGTSALTSHGAQTGHMLDGIERVLFERRPRLLVVGGDANTNLAGALAARKLGIGVAHVESGERSFDWTMPEEHNRRMIDHISDLLFATGDKAVRQLQTESVRGKIIRSGNPIVDASMMFRDIALGRQGVADRLALDDQPFGIATMHREENVDNRDALRGCLEGVAGAAETLKMPMRFYAHPRTRKRIDQFGMADWVDQLPGVECHEPAGYLDFLTLLTSARVVFTDSGGVQQEACIHQVPCVTLRENTEWTETVESGANRLAGTDPARIVAAARAATASMPVWDIPFGDGTARVGICDAIESWLRSAAG